MPSYRLASSVLALSLAAVNTFAQDTCGTCSSFGVDIESGGTYFQNSLSTAPFTLVQEFEGCQNDSSYNVLVDPNGDQYQCTDTPLQPDDTPETVTCPLDKNELYSGDWSLLILSNNGDNGCDPIAFERDFSLSVGPQSTITVAPTITVSTVFTPVESDTVTSTQVITSSARPTTTTVPLINLFKPTITIQPLPSVQVVTKAILTLTSTSTSANIIATTTETSTATCQLPRRRQVRDPVASIVATILGGLLNDIGLKERSAEPTAMPMARSASTEYKRAIIEGRAVAPKVKAQFLAERSERLALERRDIDEPTITVTADSAVETITSTSTAATSTVVGTTTLVQTTTVTPTVTVSRGIGGGGIAIVTAAPRTITNTFFVPATTVLVSTTEDVTLTISSTVTPAAVAASCSSAGGVLS